jgi:GntR family transcriptional regulator
VVWSGYASAGLAGYSVLMIDPDSPQWPYQQVAAILRDRIDRGELGPRLPSHMQLAQQLGVSPMTVQRALRVLKDEGLLYSEPGRGTFVRRSLSLPG